MLRRVIPSEAPAGRSWDYFGVQISLGAPTRTLFGLVSLYAAVSSSPSRNAICAYKAHEPPSQRAG